MNENTTQPICPHPTEITFAGMVKFFYNSNPFYLISAVLILYAQNEAFGTTKLSVPTFVPLTVIAFYTLLLAATAVFLVKWGKVWDDARSLILIVLVLLLVLSVSSDSEMLDSLYSGAIRSGAGLLFAAALLETVRRLLKITLSRAFAIPCWIFLGLFFFYPLLNAQLITMFPNTRTPGMIGILCFPIVSGLLLLSFLPAILRKQPEENGTPWKEPLFPWSLVWVFGVASIIRTYLLTISFQPGRGVGGYGQLETAFNPYMLAPILLAGLVLMAEYAKARGSENLKKALPFLAVFFLFLLPSSDPTSQAKRALLDLCGGNTTAIISGAALLYFVYLLVRDFRDSVAGIASVTLFIGAECRSDAIPLPWFTGIAVLLFLLYAIRRNTTVSWSIMVIGWSLSLIIQFVDGDLFEATDWTAALLYCGILSAFLLLGTIRQDKAAEGIRRFALGMILLSEIWVLCFMPHMSQVYLFVGLTVPAAASCLWRKNRGTLIFLAAYVFVWFVGGAFRGYWFMADHFDSVKWFFLAMTFFGGALGMSLHKAFRKRGANGKESPAAIGENNGEPLP